MAENTVLDLNSLMTESLDNIADMPDYSNPPAGEYSLEVKNCEVDSYTAKDGTDKQRLKITYAVAQTISTADNEPPVADGTLFTETFMATEQGLSFFKRRIKDLMAADSVTGVTLADMMDSVKGAIVKARITIRKTAKPGVPGEFYENLNIRIVK